MFAREGGWKLFDSTRKAAKNKGEMGGRAIRGRTPEQARGAEGEIEESLFDL